jgi:hypothetical protein
MSTMTLIALWAFLGVPGPATAPSTRPATQPAAELSADDERVINLCLAEFRRHEHGPFREGERDKLLIVHRQTNEVRNWYLKQDQIEAESRTITVPRALIDAVNARAVRDQKLVLDGFAPDDARVVVDDVDRASTRGPLDFEIIEFPKAFPGACAYVRIWLPAYSEDGKQAIFRFFFGPTAHGASATFLLRKNAAGQWRVVATQISYYA